MADYDGANPDQTSGITLRIISIGANFPGLSGAGFDIQYPDGSGAEAVRRTLPDAIIVDAQAIDAALVACLAEPLFAAMPVILLAGDEDADAAGLILERRIEIVDRGAVSPAVEQAIASLGRKIGASVADASGHYDGIDKIAALKRDAERVAAALNELMGSRPVDTVRPVDAGRIRAHIRARRNRDRFFPSDLFADPVWDMLLDLAAARLEARKVSISSLCIAAAVPTTTGLRWIKAMVDRGMLERESDPSDARRSFIAMAPSTAQGMDACLDAVLNHPGQ